MKSYCRLDHKFDLKLRARLHRERGFPSAPMPKLAEVFSSLTKGNLEIRLSADDAPKLLTQLAGELDFIDLTAREMVAAFKKARWLGVHGGRVHDFLHAVAAEKAGADKIITLDENDFDGLTKLEIEQV